MPPDRVPDTGRSALLQQSVCLHQHRLRGSAMSLHQIIAALQDRAKMGMLLSADLGEPSRFEFWKARHNALTEVLELHLLPPAARFLAPYQPPGHSQAAWSAMPEDIKALTFAQAAELCRAERIGITGHRLPQAEVTMVEQLVDGMAVANRTEVHDEQARLGVHLDDGACCAHRLPPECMGSVGIVGSAPDIESAKAAQPAGGQFQCLDKPF